MDRKRELIDGVREDWRVSVRRACKVLRFDRSADQYVSRRTYPAVLKRRIKEICVTRALLDRLTHLCDIVETGNES